MKLKELVLLKAIHEFEDIGFMDWHARVLRELSVHPQTIKEISRKTGLFHYHINGVLQDLLALQLIEYTRKGISIRGEWEMLEQLTDCCQEKDIQKHTYDWEAAFEVVTPKVVALKKRIAFDE